MADQDTNFDDEEIILPASLPQKVFSRYQTNFARHHDRGFYLAATLGPQWNHSIKDPKAKAIRFGGKFGLGWYVADGVALYGAAWGNFLEQASLVAGGSFRWTKHEFRFVIRRWSRIYRITKRWL